MGRIAFIFGRIFKNDRRHPGVLVEVRKTTAVDIIWNMIKLKVISKDDLNDFLDELKQEMERRTIVVQLSRQKSKTFIMN